MSLCHDCPRHCAVDRSKERGYCGLPALPVVARIALHQGEEPCLIGQKGALTVFFAGCNLRCAFCQNQCISRGLVGRQMTLDELYAAIMAQVPKAASLDLVTATCFSSVLLPLLRRLRAEALPIPIVWNSSAYENVEQLRRLEGLVDIYLPDLKYIDRDSAARYSDCPDYPEQSRLALAEMQRQTGPCQFAPDGRLLKGVLVRHLLLPGQVLPAKRLMLELNRNYGAQIGFALLRQYSPCNDLSHLPELQRTVSESEYHSALTYLKRCTFQPCYGQEDCQNSAVKTPDFNLCGVELPLPPAVQAIFERFDQSADGPCYLVGGAVRNYLLGLPVKDFDFAVPLAPTAVAELFPEARVMTVGERFGNVGLYFEGSYFELTQFRLDGPSADHRHPQKIEAVRSLKEDLQRRDFTVNALAYHPRLGLIDEVGGCRDLWLGRIRTVGEPSRRFQEDALRILRGLRFAAELDFRITPETLRAMQTDYPLIRNLPVERIYKELQRFFAAAHWPAAYRRYGKIWQDLYPELFREATNDETTHVYAPDDWEANLAQVLKPGQSAAFQALFSLSQKAAKRLAAWQTLSAWSSQAAADEAEVMRLLQSLQYLEDTVAGSLDEAGRLPSAISQALAALRASGRYVRLQELALQAEQLQAAGLSGPALGQALRRALELVQSGRCPNDAALLLKEVLK